MPDLSFTEDAWEQYQQWGVEDKAVLKRINKLLREIMRTPFDGIGKPEPLKHDLAGYWSRRIDEKHRIIYAVEDDKIRIITCREHYKNN